MGRPMRLWVEKARRLIGDQRLIAYGGRIKLVLLEGFLTSYGDLLSGHTNPVVIGIRARRAGSGGVVANVLFDGKDLDEDFRLNLQQRLAVFHGDVAARGFIAEIGVALFQGMIGYTLVIKGRLVRNLLDGPRQLRDSFVEPGLARFMHDGRDLHGRSGFDPLIHNWGGLGLGCLGPVDQDFDAAKAGGVILSPSSAAGTAPRHGVEDVGVLVSESLKDQIGDAMGAAP